ncbi:MAG: hypothetical protein QOE79_1035 [Sphingomonadales bacterium]|nr:hypothetical protein [Sphingomonadales bacterium]MEA3048296.1 hypothetical protein [Sphingomonadales bacterium]
MNPWPFVAAAYAAALLGTAGLLLWSYAAMRGAERAAEALGSDR